MEITRYRGDNKPFRFNLYSDKKAGIRLNLTGLTFQMTVNEEKDPENTNKQKFSLEGIIVDAENGVLEFRPTKIGMNLAKGIYYYDIQVTDANLCDDTVMKDKFVINQDLTK